MQIQELGATVSGQLHRAVAFASGDTGILGVLRQEHVEVLSRLHRLVGLLHDPKRTRLQFRHLRAKLEAHCAAEEQVLYAQLGDSVHRGRLSGQAEHEHAAIRHLLAELDEQPVDPISYRHGLESLQRACALHFQDEEENLFELARHSFDRHTRHTMASRFRRLRDRQLHTGKA